MAPQLGKDERHEELTEHNDREQPDVLRSSGADAEHEQRIDADDGRDVAEGDREVLEQVEDAPQLLAVPELRELSSVCVNRLGRRDHVFATHRRLLRPRPPKRAACGRKYRSAMRGSASGVLRR